MFNVYVKRLEHITYTSARLVTGGANHIAICYTHAEISASFILGEAWTSIPDQIFTKQMDIAI